MIYKLFICSCYVFWVLIELQVAAGEHLSHDMSALSLKEVLWVDRASVDLLTNLCLQPLNSLLFDIILFVLLLGFYLILLGLRERGHFNLHFIAKGQNLVNLVDLVDDSDAVLRKLQLNLFHIPLKFLFIFSRWVFEAPSHQDIRKLIHYLLHLRYKAIFL